MAIARRSWRGLLPVKLGKAHRARRRPLGRQARVSLTIVRLTEVFVDDLLFENVYGDALDFDAPFPLNDLGCVHSPSFCSSQSRIVYSLPPNTCHEQEYGDVSKVVSIKSKDRSSSATTTINTVRDTPCRNSACRPRNAASTLRVILANSQEASVVSHLRDIHPSNILEANGATCPRRGIRHISREPAILPGGSCHGLVICHHIRRASGQTLSNREVQLLRSRVNGEVGCVALLLCSNRVSRQTVCQCKANNIRGKANNRDNSRGNRGLVLMGSILCMIIQNKIQLLHRVNLCSSSSSSSPPDRTTQRNIQVGDNKS